MATGDVFANQFSLGFVIQGWTSMRDLIKMVYLIFLIDQFLICVHVSVLLIMSI